MLNEGRQPGGLLEHYYQRPGDRLWLVATMKVKWPVGARGPDVSRTWADLEVVPSEKGRSQDGFTSSGFCRVEHPRPRLARVWETLTPTRSEDCDVPSRGRT